MRGITSVMSIVVFHSGAEGIFENLSKDVFKVNRNVTSSPLNHNYHFKEKERAHGNVAST